MSEYSASYEQEGEEEDVHEIEIEDAVKELKVMFPDVDDDIILNALMVNNMSLEETIDDLIKRTKKMKVYNPEEASKQSSKVYDELDEDQEEMINKTRSEFFGTSIHRVNLLRDRQKEERKKLQYKISEDEISDKIWKARLKYACTMPPPEYKFSQKVDFQSSNNILADYFQIGITGHDDTERDKLLISLFQSSKEEEHEREMAIKVQSDLIKKEMVRFDEEEDELQEQVGKPSRSKVSKKTMFLRNK